MINVYIEDLASNKIDSTIYHSNWDSWDTMGIEMGNEWIITIPKDRNAIHAYLSRVFSLSK